MQKFILLRGHEGAGKSTFAKHQMAQFQAHYPRAKLVYLDNDVALTDEHGVYHFDFEKFAQAHQQNQALFQAALQWGKHHRHRPILIINANPNQKTKTCLAQLTQAQQAGFITQCYRLHYFFANVHGVPEHDVQQSYQRLNANPVAGEIHLPPLYQIDLKYEYHHFVPK